MRSTELVTRETWDAALARFGEAAREAYFTFAYHALHGATMAARPVAFLCERGGEALFVPGMRCPIDGPSLGFSPDDVLFDLQTPNGYGGPLATTDDASFLDEAWAGWARSAGKEGAVAAFFRLHPTLENERFLPRSARVLLDRRTALVDLDGGVAAQWSRMQPRRRTTVRKARRGGVTVRWNEPLDWSAYAELYDRAMAGKNADRRLRFDGAYFDALRGVRGTELACVDLGRGVVAGDVFLFGPRVAHYHLGARSDDAPPYVASALMQASIERAAELGLASVHLGGGVTTAVDDALLRFKQSFGARLVDYRVALVVADADRYEALTSAWQRASGGPPRWLLGYRQPFTAGVGDERGSDVRR